MNELLIPGNNMDNILAWPPSYPYSSFGIQVEIMVPIPTLEELVSYLLYVFLFDFSFKKPYQTSLLLMQEDFDILLLIRPIKASNVPNAYSGIGGKPLLL